jgi:NAD(P)-dependent dehydrogenase (short-subunit alcohol dehydrogenase family)
MFSLAKKVAVITGGASGIGRAAAQRFAAAGARVAIADIGDGSSVAREVGGIFVKTDVSAEGQVKALFEAVMKKFGRLDILVNNAGMAEPEARMITELDGGDLDRVLSVNLKGVVWGIKHGAPCMTGGGAIVNTSSYAGLFGTPTYSIYVMTKAAILGVTKTAALELAPLQIRVNAICPSTVDTPMAYTEGAEVELAVSAMMQPIQRIARPEEAAALLHFLVSDEAAFITGAAVPFDGGLSAGPALGMVGVLYEKAMGQQLDVDALRGK